MTNVVFRDMAREKRKGVNAMRGLLVGAVISLLLWIVIGGIGVAVLNAH